MIADSTLIGAPPSRAAALVENKTGFGSKLGWSIGATTFGTAGYAKILFLPFLVDYVGVSPALAASLIAMSNLYDAVIDSAIGIASDRTSTRWGRRVPYLFASSIGLALAWLIMFNPPALSPPLLIGYIILCLMVYSTAYGAFSVPYNAMPAEMTSSYHSRSTLMVLKTVFITGGSTAGGLFAPTLIAKAGGGRIGHSVMSLAMAGVTLVTGLICVAMVVRFANPTALLEPPVKAALKLSLRQRLASVLRNRPFLVLMFSHFLAMAGVAMMNSGVVFYVRRVLQASDAWLGGFYFWMNTFIFACLPIWLWVSRRIGKRNAFLIGAVILGVTMMDWRFARPSDPFWVYITRTFFTSLGSS